MLFVPPVLYHTAPQCDANLEFYSQKYYLVYFSILERPVDQIVSTEVRIDPHKTLAFID